MNPSNLDQIQYYVELNENELPSNRLSRITVTSKDDLFDLPILHYQSYYIPRKHRKLYYENKIKKMGRLSSSKLDYLQESCKLMLGNLSNEDYLELLLDADTVCTPMDIAKSVLFQHPSLANVQPYTAAIVMYDHIAPSREAQPEQYSRMMEFAEQIRKQGPDGWAKRTYATNQKTGKPLTYEYDVLGHKAGDKVEIYSLSDATLAASKGALSNAMNTSSQDSSLMGTSWHMTHGLVREEEDEAIHVKNNLTRKQSLKATDDGGVKWTLNEDVSLTGLYTYKDTIEFKDNVFQMDVRNVHLRTLSSYVEFFDDKGNPIEHSSSYVRTIGAVDTVMGIPVPIFTTNLKFNFDKRASKAKLYFGSHGTSNWKWEYDCTGAVLTAIFQYGIPSFFLAADCMMASNKFFNDCEDEIEFVLKVVEVFLDIANIGATSADAAELAEGLLLEGAKVIGGLLVEKVMEKVLAYIIATITAETAANCIPIAGQVLQIAAVAADTAQLLETTVEVLASPATMELSITRAMDLDVTVSPDPEHGVISETGSSSGAIWPTTADNWQLQLIYKGGTTKTVTGTFPSTNSDTPIHNTLTDVPMGGSMKLSFYTYSKTGWLCGKWESDWMEALPDSNESGKKTVTGAIKEVLVPLTVDVQYEYKQKIIYDEAKGQYVWHSGDKPTETITALDAAGTGDALCKLVNLTYNSKKKQLGYVWSASGKNLPTTGNTTASIEYLVQNMSTLADDSLKKYYKAGEVGFVVEPLIAYDKFGNGRDNFILDTRNHQCHLRKVELEDGSEGFGLNGSDLVSYGRFNQNTLDAFVIHPDGYAIGVNYANSKMEVLEIPEKGSSDDHAVVAQLVSGEGFIEGRMQGPVAIKVSPAGAILVLESANRRIQAFNTTGNPVPSFQGKKEFDTDTTGIVQELDAKRFSEQLQEAFDKNNLTEAFTISDKYEETLDQATISDELKQEFADHGIYLCVDMVEDETTGELAPTATIQVVTEHESWKLMDSGRGYTYNLKKQENDIVVTVDWTDAIIDVHAEGKEWLIQDKNHTKAYLALVENAQTKVLSVYQYISYMNLYNPAGSTEPTYLDFSVEAKGYLYVLSYINSGKEESDYYLDLYHPDGTFLVRTPDERLCAGVPQHVNAARIDVDEFRNMHTLNFEKMFGKKGYAEPTISQWTPTTPLFDLEKEKNTEFKQGNMTAIKADFAAHNVKLSEQATVETVIPDGQYHVNDTETVNGESQKVIYDVIYCVDLFEVYKLIMA